MRFPPRILRHVLGTARDVAAIVVRSAVVERDRLRLGPEAAVGAARRRGARAVCRAPAELRDLRRLIRSIDRRWPGGPSCYRRVLLEIAVDAGAARQPFQMGLRDDGGPRSGHAWLGTGVEIDDPTRAPYSAIISL